MSRVARLPASVAVSVLLHAATLVLVLRELPASPTRAAVVIPITLVGQPGGGSGGESGPAPAPPAETAPPQPAANPVSTHAPVHRAVPRKPAPVPAAPRESTVASAGETPSGSVGDAATGMRAGAGGGGAGDGSGDGAGGARVAYGANPLPDYPMVARRLGKEGVVILEVVVAPDGRPSAVRVVQSCGFAPLDESALTTVRARWRFIPARRDGTPVESRVTVPIRFRLSDAIG